ncbi:putative major facilitator superfamily domain-containing protein [Neospora caninum Liverpool]|uniref:Major facilitator superfamily domain-containing protein, putative n=1 Tax=Neospora caninum (strain Liverpool) TaxID=572307 RepID=F0VAH8_NEOCL|nr:putative major facilitator superfamily domain-containing protein [Neospora caninum Liverpool]CBZ50667.1 putative major facilitator superfamily domain-containing protein [Neospora caninum Liverpool]CEL65278.1 TPA: major facilitator superfamily domain-containing protein, putative [Neospora caninum Liverpool]|eukprot:XP_003880700.1 putative major facilitator superfamily domain-containing protein [Neospora caninum Liverpool]
MATPVEGSVELVEQEADPVCPRSRSGVPGEISVEALSTAANVLESRPSEDDELGAAAAGILCDDRESLEGKESLVPPVTGSEAAAALQPRPFNLNRYVLLVVYILYTFASARVLFGWPSLSSMLFRAGAFEWLCRDEPSVTDKRYLCRAQDSAVQLLFTVGVAVAFCFSLAAGLLMDFQGPKVCACVGQLMNTVGWVLLGVASEDCQTYIPGVFCLALGADAGYLPSLNISNLFPGQEGLVIVTMSAAMSASFSVPTIMDGFWRNHPEQSFFWICVTYAITGTGVCFLVALFLFPSRSYMSQEELMRESRQGSSSANAPASTERNEKPEAEALTTKEAKTAWEPVDGEPAEAAVGRGSAQRQGEGAQLAAGLEASATIPFAKQLRSPYFYCFYIYWPLNALFYNFYMTSAENLFNAHVNDVLGILGPLSMVPAILLGKLADTWGVMALVLFIISSGVLMYAFALSRFVPCYYVSAVFSCLYLSNFSGQMYAYMSDTFRSTDFGKVVGVTSATGGLLSLLRIPLHDDLTLHVLDGDYFYTCLMMLGLTLVCLCLALYLFFLKRRWPKAYLACPKNAPSDRVEADEQVTITLHS